MKMPIPTDWDGETWANWSVCWPDSSEWNGILQGQLTDPAKGFFWDGQTGSIVTVQETGYEISEDNVPLKGCLMRCDEQLDELIDAIIGLKGQGGADACGCPGGSTQGSTNGTEGGTPPQFFDDPPDAYPTAAYFSRKCKIANMNHEQVRAWLQAMKDGGVDAYIGKGLVGPAVFILLTTILGAVLGEISTPFPLIDALAGGVVGFIASIASVILAQSFDLDTLIALIDANEDDLVCAFYAASTAQDAKDDYIQVLDDAGASAGALLLLQAVFVVDTLNALFFSSEENPDLETALAGYTPTIPCNCACSGWTIIFGNLLAGDPTDGNPFSVDSIFSSSGGCSRHQVQVDIIGDTCVYDTTHAAPGIVSKCCGSTPCWALAYTDENGDEQLEDPYAPATQCMKHVDGHVGLAVRGEAAFTLNISYTEGCP